MERAYHRGTRILGVLISGLGIAVVVTTIERGGGPLSLGVVVGVCLAVFGAGRALLAGAGRGSG